MSKKASKAAKGEAEMDPAVAKVQSVLEENLTYFMSNIGQFIKKFDDHLTAALPGNPKAKEEPKKLTSPLLKREPGALGDAATATEAPASEEGTVDVARPRPRVIVEETEDEISITFPNNDDLREQLALLKREAYELGTTFDGIHDWVALNIPDMREEGEIGVEVMGAVIEQTSSLADSTRGVYSLELKYLSERSEAEKALLKCPDSRSLQLALETNDADTWDEIERAWRTLIRVCLILYSVLAKNMNKLREPRKAMQTHMMM